MRKPVVVVVLLLVGFLLFYLNLPVINYGFTGFAVILFILILAFSFLTAGVITKNKKVSIQFTKLQKAGFGIAVLLLVYIVLLPLLTSAPMFRSQAYRAMI